MTSRTWIAGIALAAMASTANAGDRDGTATAEFLNIPVGARMMGMAGAGVASASGAEAIYWNPAGVADGHVSATFTHHAHFAEMTQEYAAVAIPAGNDGSIGVSFNYFSAGDMVRTTEDQPEGDLGMFDAFSAAAGVTYSRVMTDRVSVGATVKYVTETIAEVTQSGVAFDFGFGYDLDYNGLTLGVVMRNIGPQMAFDGSGLQADSELGVPSSIDAENFELPAGVNFSATMNVVDTEASLLAVSIAQDLPNFGADSFNVGAEYSLYDQYYLRGGFQGVGRETEYERGGLCAGGGLYLDLNDSMGLAVDYAYTDMGILDTTHRYSVSLLF